MLRHYCTSVTNGGKEVQNTFHPQNTSHYEIVRGNVLCSDVTSARQLIPDLTLD